MNFILLLLIFALLSITSGTNITCRFNYDISYPEIGQVYTCDVISMDFSENSTFITGYDGEHWTSSHTSEHVIMIRFATECREFNFKNIPKGFLDIFSNFIALHFWDCGINSLSGDEITEYPNLQWFGLENSELSRIPGDFFASTPNMRFVTFRWNQLQHVGENLLGNLLPLQQAHFFNSSCINQVASSPSQIPVLIEALKVQCPDIESTTQLTTSTSSEPLKCEIDEIEDFVCELDETIKILKLRDEELLDQVDKLKDKNENLSENNEILQEKVEQLNNKFDEQAVKLEDQAARLIELEATVSELVNRPCECKN
jgi:hypothetical protein